MTPLAGLPWRASDGARARRLEGVDIARALAMIGMLMVHVGPMYQDDLAGRLYALPHGRASVLFMLVAGVGVSLLARGRDAGPGVLTSRLLWRALLLLPVGLVLQEIDNGRLVILQTYAAMFLVAAGAVYCSDRWLLAVAGVAAVGGPLVFLYGRLVAPLTFNRAAITPDLSPGEILHALVLSGPYPLITWIVPFALGMWIGRRDLRDPRLRKRLVLAGGGAALAAAGLAGGLQAVFGEPGYDARWSALMTMGPHSQMPLWLAAATASAVTVLGLSLLLAELGARWTWPLVATGQVALTFYVAHLLALTEWPQMMKAGEPGQALFISAVFTLIAAALAVVWRALLPRGPLEMFLQPPWLAAWRWAMARR